MAALLRTAVRQAAPTFRFSGHPAATGAAMVRTFQRRTMHSGGGWHRFYTSPMFFGGAPWDKTDNYFAVFAVTVMLAYHHYVTDQAEKRWCREQSRREQQEMIWARFQRNSPINAEGGVS